MPDTEYADIETAMVTHLQGDAWLGSTTNVGLIHRFPRAHLPSYRQSQLPAIAVAVDAESPERRPALGTVERRIQIILEIIHAGGRIEAMTEKLLEIANRAAERLRVLSLPNALVGKMHDLSPAGIETFIGIFPNQQYVLMGHARIDITRIEEYSANPGASGPIIAPETEITDVQAGLVTALSADATLSAAAKSILAAPRTLARNNPQADYPMIEVFASSEEPDQPDTFELTERSVPVRIAVTGRGGDLDVVENTVKQLIAGVRRVIRSEAFKGNPAGGAAEDLENGRMQVVRGTAESEDIDPYTIVGVTEVAAHLAA